MAVVLDSSGLDWTVWPSCKQPVNYLDCEIAVQLYHINGTG